MKYVTVVRIGVKPVFKWLKWLLPKHCFMCGDVKAKGKVFFRVGVGDYVQLKKVGKVHDCGFVYPQDTWFFRLIKVRGNPLKAINPKRSKRLLEKVK